MHIKKLKKIDAQRIKERRRLEKREKARKAKENQNG